ncbi:MAG: LysM peptidoglycan-binding domain-containing protein [Bdellovibrionales bacterium]|nr:LysM peptidoglycan-binding domain-containing protein [Bdellovibrionales bacterium]
MTNSERPHRGLYNRVSPAKALLAALVATTSVGLLGCTSRAVRLEGSTGTAGVSASSSGAVSSSANQAAADSPNDLSDSGADLMGIPLEVNRLVLKWIDYFQGPGRHHMERYLSRSSRYAPIMKEILRKEGLPEDLIYIALIESGFSATAHSSANAVGYWQFIRGTGKQYRLRIDSLVDERRDFEKATVAAADYFKGLYNLFGAWYLAIASYNVGENRVKGLVMRNKTRDFWKLARENRLPQETVNYVPKFLAARLIAKEPDKYGFGDVEYMPALDFKTVTFSTPIDIRRLASEMGLEYDDLRDLNPAYKRGVAPMPKGSNTLVLRVPTGLEAKALAAAPAAVASQAARFVAAEDDYSYYRVRRGDTISSIAKKFNVSQAQVLRLNRMSARSVLSVGRRLRVPSENVATLGPGKSSQLERPRTPAGKPSSSTRVAARSRQVSKAETKMREAAKRRNPAASRRVHVVRRGENLAVIARRYNVSVRELANHNRIQKKSVLFVGRRLEIPML